MFAGHTRLQGLTLGSLADRPHPESLKELWGVVAISGAGPAHGGAATRRERQKAANRADPTGGLQRQITHSDHISLAQPRHRLHPAEAGTARRARVDGAAAIGVVLCHMRRQIQTPSADAENAQDAFKSAGGTRVLTDKVSEREREQPGSDTVAGGPFIRELNHKRTES
jgi:hypothetical protein